MKKLILLSNKEALLIQSALSDFSVNLNLTLRNGDQLPLNVCEQVLDDLDLCDDLRRKLSRFVSNLSIFD